MLLSEKIERLNELCDDSLSITKYSKWSVNSFKSKTALNEIQGYIEGDTFEEMIDNALEYIEKNKNTITLNGKKYKLVE
jgi:hypothetical protein